MQPLKEIELTRSAVLPEAVGPVTTVNLPSGNFTERLRSSKARRPASVALTSELLSATAVPSSSTVVVAWDTGLVLLASFFGSSTTAFHVKLASSRPSPSSSELDEWFLKFALRDDTWSLTSSSSRNTAMRSSATPAFGRKIREGHHQIVWSELTWRIRTIPSGRLFKAGLFNR